MKIAVCVKEVPDAGASRRHDPAADHRLVRDGDPALNPFDAHAIEAALQHAEGADGVTVTAVCMGPASAQRSVQKALALGADDAVLISDDALAGSDVLGTARVLAAAIERGGYDLVLMGQQSADGECWVLPGVVAALLGWPVLTQAASLSIEDGSVRIDRQAEAGYEKVGASLPAIVSVSDAINEPRYPSLKAIMGAKRKPLEQLDLAALDLPAGSVGQDGARSIVRSVGDPPPQPGGTVIEDDGSAADRIVEFLRERNLV